MHDAALVSRRAALQIGGLGLLGLTVPKLLRAAETGRWVVQVSPTGFSAFVSPDGDVLARTGVSEQAVIVHDVPLRGGTTWYAQLGDRPWVVLAALTLAIAWWATRRSRRVTVSGWVTGWVPGG